ncbi:MAG: hypothetical protein IT287_09555 [Bdellovibrionaceae bacterium]|nr:hypothetical protein [Pseudobdellovibrionaceae bacterium]
MFTQYSVNYKKIVILDFSSEISVCSTYAAAQRLVEQTDLSIVFGAPAEMVSQLPKVDRLKVLATKSSQLEFVCEDSDIVLDFTEPGEGIVDTSMIAQRVEHFHFSRMMGTATPLQKKVDFLSLHLSHQLSIASLEKSTTPAPILTYDAKMAARLNMLGICTIELCYRFRKHGSFLPGSLVIYGDNFALISKRDLDMIFEIYQQGQIENLFLNKPVLEMEWDLLYYQMDRSQKSATTKNYPVSNMETFLDLFFKCFIAEHSQGDAGLDKLVYLTKKIDVIDLEETFKFVRGHLNRCLKDIDEKNYPLRGPWWSYIRPYMIFEGSTSFELSKTLRKCIIGLEMFENIYERQRKLLSMH